MVVTRGWDVGEKGRLKKKEREKKGTENLLEEIISENFPNLAKETDIQVQEAQGIPKKMNPKRPTPRHIIIKMSKVKESYKQ